MSDLIERLHIERPAWPDPNGELVRYSDHVAALAEKDARIAELLAETHDLGNEICGLNDTIDDLNGNLDRLSENYRIVEDRAETWMRERDTSRAECEGLRAERDEARKKLSACRWYWPEDDTSSDCCGESAQEIVQNAYDWSSKNAGGVIAVARGGIVEVTYCASLPPADDADSDDDFWVEEATREAAQAKIDAEKARRAALSQKETGNAA